MATQKIPVAKKGKPIPVVEAPAGKRSYLSQAEVPGCHLEEALRVPRAIAENYAAKPSSPLNVAAALEMQPNAGRFRLLTGAAIAYGLTSGGPNATEIAISPLGMRIVRCKQEGDDLVARREALLRLTPVSDKPPCGEGQTRGILLRGEGSRGHSVARGRWMAADSNEGQPSAVSAYLEAGNGYGGGEGKHRRATWNVEQHSQAGGTEEMNAEYVVVIEKSETGFGAYVPDLPGCVAVGETREEALSLIREGIELHVESLREAGESVPPPTSTAERVAVHVAA